MTHPPSSPPNAPRIGGLCFGYGGLDLAVQSVIPSAQLAWYAEFDKGASKIGAHRFPGVPNHGDMTKIDWATVEPVDILTGGTPCQDLSHAGKRAGMTEGTRSNLWVAMREAIAQIKPRLVVWENVGGAFSAAADSEVEPCAGCVGDGSATHLRALGRVLGDLAALGFDAEWRALRAADVGAPHGRLRVFVVAYPSGIRRGAWRPAGPREAQGGRPLGDVAGRRQHACCDPSGVTFCVGCGDDIKHGRALPMLPTPQARDFKGFGPADGNRHDPNLSAIPLLLPTPRAGDGEKCGPNQRGSSGDLMLPSAAVSLLPTPTSMDSRASGGNPDTTGTHGTTLTDATARRPQEWGQYAAAIHRWEALTRPAPSPTETGPRGNPRLSAAFSEWMMGLPAGWVTDVPGITRNEALKALGNGVVPQQAAAALVDMLTVSEVAA